MAKTPASMSATEKPGIKERISLFLHRGRYVFWSFFGTAAVLLAGYFLYTEIDRSRRERSTVLVEEAAAQLEEWKAEPPGENRDNLEKSLGEKLDLILRKYPRQYADQRARMVQASVLVAGEKWEQAATTYLGLAGAFPRSYLAPMALFDAAVCLENAKDEEGAIDAYGRIIDRHAKSYLAPHALFSRGRLYEAIGELDKAKADYTSLSDNHPSSNWTSFAKNRILALKIKGR